ncbi:hypothetical protein CSPX01_11444 [Colletotrichum filicis]|nr:hypothetical protein CSPX01_11444 [Colletotrichum filicis]
MLSINSQKMFPLKEGLGMGPETQLGLVSDTIFCPSLSQSPSLPLVCTRSKTEVLAPTRYHRPCRDEFRHSPSSSDITKPVSLFFLPRLLSPSQLLVSRSPTKYTSHTYTTKQPPILRTIQRTHGLKQDAYNARTRTRTPRDLHAHTHLFGLSLLTHQHPTHSSYPKSNPFHTPSPTSHLNRVLLVSQTAEAAPRLSLFTYRAPARTRVC